MTNSTLTKKEMVMTVLENARTMNKEDKFAMIVSVDGDENVLDASPEDAEWYMSVYETASDDMHMNITDSVSMSILAIGRFHKDTTHEEMEQSLNNKRL